MATNSRNSTTDSGPRHADEVVGSRSKTEAVIEVAMEADTVLGREQWQVLADHSLDGIPLLPGALFIELAARARDPGAFSPLVVTALEFHEPVFFDVERPPRLDVVYGTNTTSTALGDTTGLTFRANGRAVGACDIVAADAARPSHPADELIRPSAGSAGVQSTAQIYGMLASRGNTYGPYFQRLDHAVLGAGRAVSVFRPDDASSRSIGLTLALDAAVQLLALAAGERTGVFVLERIERVELAQPLDHAMLTIEARIEAGANGDPSTGQVTGHALIADDQGQVVARLDGLTVRFHAEAVSPESLSVAATFTAEPLADGMEFWMELLGRKARPEFAPFNQVFQELYSPSSLLARNRRGANIVLLRMEDWLGVRDGLRQRVSDEQREALLADQKRTRLPNQLEIAHLNDYETDHLYQEIFVDRVYGKHGIRLDDNACVIDVGANIGMFSLWIQRECRNPRVLAIEPAPAAFAALSTNIDLYAEGVTALACGLGQRDGEAAFTYYERSSVFSGFKADPEKDEQAIRAIVGNVLRQTGRRARSADALSGGPLANGQSVSELSANATDDVREDLPDDVIDELLAERVASTTLMRPVKSLSGIIQEHDIKRIDLLKIDAEKSELDILAGIDDADWPKIQQLVMEIHDRSGVLLEDIRALLSQKGFRTLDVEEDVFQGSGFRNLYARRESDGAQTAASDSSTSPRDPAEERLERAIDDFINALRTMLIRSPVPFVVAVCPPSPESDQYANILATGETRLLAALIDHAPTSLLVISSQELASSIGIDHVHDRETERLGAIPYTPLFFAALSTRIARWLRARTASPIKVAVLDCDQTLWSGVCGEDGPLGVKVDPQRVYLQEFLRRQREQGTLLALCSKNREEDVRAVFTDNPGMLIEWQELSAHAINWQPKSQNIRAIASQLSLGLDSILFIDDNPVECAEVSANCPGVIALPLPQEAESIREFLDNLWAFDRLDLTEEDQARAERYRQERQRESFRESTSSFADFLAGLELQVDIAPPAKEQLSRMAQLTQRTNQFNLSTIRRTEAELSALLELAELEARIVNVRDRFGEYGLVGLMLYARAADHLMVDTFLLSCRVLGRGVEHKMLAVLGRLAMDDDLESVVLPYRKTPRNEPALHFAKSVAGDADTAADADEQVFRVRSDIAAKTTLVASAGAHDVQAMETSEQRGPTAPSLQGKQEAARLMHIAVELSRPQAILAAIESRRRRQRPVLASNFVAPSSDLETAVAQAWQVVLGLEQIGVDDNFFELGGSSLKAVQLIARLRRTVAPNITIVGLFEHPTVRRLARMLDPQNAADAQRRVSESAERGAKRRDRKRSRKKKAGRREHDG